MHQGRVGDVVGSDDECERSFTLTNDPLLSPRRHSIRWRVHRSLQGERGRCRGRHREVGSLQQQQQQQHGVGAVGAWSGQSQQLS